MSRLSNQTAHQYLKLILTGILIATLSLACKKSSDSKEIFRDGFDRADGGLGASYNVYLPSGSSFVISGMRAWPSTTSTALPAAIHNQRTGVTYKASAKFIINGTDFAGDAYIIAKSTSADIPSNAYACGYLYDSGTAPEIHKFFLGKLTSGTMTILGQAAMHTLVSGTTDTITFTSNYNSLKCEISGGSTISITVNDNSYGDGFVGLMGGKQNFNFVYFDDFLIERL